jgi:hypothetical protein
MIDASYAPVAIAALLCALLFVRNKVFVAAQPKRLELAERGELLLQSSRVNSHVKENVRFCLDHAFGARSMLIKEILFVPLFALMVLFKLQWVCQVVRENEVHDKSTRSDVTDFFSLYDEIAWANNPVLMAVMSIQFHVLVSIAIVCRIVLLSTFPTVEKWTVKPVLDECVAWFSAKMPLRIA